MFLKLIIAESKPNFKTTDLITISSAKHTIHYTASTFPLVSKNYYDKVMNSDTKY